jgi:hypothetical protein
MREVSNVRLTGEDTPASLAAHKLHVWDCLRPPEYGSRIPQTCAEIASSTTLAVVGWHSRCTRIS